MARSENNLRAVLQDTADAIRSKTGASASICPRDFADEISAISTGVLPVGTIEINENGLFDVSSYGSAQVYVPVPGGYVRPEGTYTVTSEGSYDVTNVKFVDVNISGAPSYRAPTVPLHAVTVDYAYSETAAVGFNDNVPLIGTYDDQNNLTLHWFGEATPWGTYTDQGVFILPIAGNASLDSYTTINYGYVYEMSDEITQEQFEEAFPWLAEGNESHVYDMEGHDLGTISFYYGGGYNS